MMSSINVVAKNKLFNGSVRLNKLVLPNKEFDNDDVDPKDTVMINEPKI